MQTPALQHLHSLSSLIRLQSVLMEKYSRRLSHREAKKVSIGKIIKRMNGTLC